MSKQFAALFACLLAAASGATAQQNIDTNEVGPFRVGQYGVEHDPIRSWAYYYSPTRRVLVALVNAHEMSDGLSRASLEIRCRDTFAGPQIVFGVQCVPAGEEYPGGEYSLDLFNSAASGRPAAYDLGEGFVRTDTVTFSGLTNEAPPEEYVEATQTFWADLQTLESDATIDIRFETRSQSGPYAWMKIPLTGLAAARQFATGYCP